MGTSNQNASFGDAITGNLGSAASNGVDYNLSSLDRVTQGLNAVGVCTKKQILHFDFSHG